MFNSQSSAFSLRGIQLEDYLKKEQKKNPIFLLFSHFILHNVCGKYLFLFLNIIQFIQVSYMPLFVLENTDQKFDEFRKFSTFAFYTKFAAKYADISVWIFLYIVHGIFIFQLIIFLLLQYLILVNSTKNTYKLIKQWTSLCIVLLNTVLLLPTIDIALQPFVWETLLTDSNNSLGLSTFSAVHIWLLCMSLIIISIILPLLVISSCLLTDMSYKSTIPWAGESPKLFLSSHLSLIIFGAVIGLDPDLSYGNTIIFFHSLVLLFKLYYRFKSSYIYEKMLNGAFIILEGILIKIYTGVLYDNIFGGRGRLLTIFLYLISGSVIGAVILVLQWRRQRKILYMCAREASEFDQVVYIYQIMDMPSKIDMTDQSSFEGLTILQGILGSERENCYNSSCICQNITNFIANSNFHFRGELKQSEKIDQVNREQGLKKLIIQNFDTLIETLIEKLLEKKPNSFIFRIASSNFQILQKGNMYKAFFQLIQAEQNKLHYFQKFQIFLSKLRVDQQISCTTSSQSENIVQGCTLKMFVNFELKSQNMLKKIYSCNQNVIHFWKNLSSSHLDPNKVYVLGNEIFANFREINASYEQIVADYPTHVLTYLIYGHFLKYIINNEVESEFIIQKGKNYQRSMMIHQLRESIGGSFITINSEAPVVIVSGNLDSIGRIIHVNQNFQQFGYNQTDLLQQNISRIIPHPINTYHDSYILNFFQNGKANILGKVVLSFIVEKSGYLTPAGILVKIMPGLEIGLNFIGIIQTNPAFIFKQLIKLPNEYHHYKKISFILASQDGTILGISRQTGRELGIPNEYFLRKKKLSNNPINIEILKKHLLDPEMDAMLEHGKEIDIDIFTMLDMLDQDFIKENERQQINQLKLQVVKLLVYMMQVKTIFSSGLMVRIYLFVVMKKIRPNDLGANLLFNEHNVKRRRSSTQNKTLSNLIGDNDLFSGSSSVPSVDLTVATNKIQDFKKKILESKKPSIIKFFQNGILIITSLLMVLYSIEMIFLLQYFNRLSDLHELDYEGGLLQVYLPTTVSLFYSYFDIANEMQNNSNTFISDRGLDIKDSIDYYLTDFEDRVYSYSSMVITSDSFQLQEWMDDESIRSKYIYEDFTVSTQNISVTKILNNYIPKAIHVLSYNVSDYKSQAYKNNFQKIDDEEILLNERNMFLLLNNPCNIDVYNAFLKINEKMNDYIQEYMNLTSKDFLIFHICIYFLIILSFVLMIYYIQKIRKSKASILPLFGEIKPSKLKKLLHSCNSFKSEFLRFLSKESYYSNDDLEEKEASLKMSDQMSFYYSADGDLNLFQNQKNLVQEQIIFQKIQTPESPIQSNLKEVKEENPNPAEEEEQNLLKKKRREEIENIIAEKIKKLNKIRINFGNTICIVIAVWITLFSLFLGQLIFDIVEFDQFNRNFQIGKLLESKSALVSFVLMYYKNLLHNKGASYEINGQKSLDYFLSQLWLNDEEYSKLKLDYFMPSNLQEITGLVRIYQSEKICDEAKDVMTDIGNVFCKDINFGILQEGIEDCLSYYINYFSYQNLILQGREEDDVIWTELLAATEITEFEMILQHVLLPIYLHYSNIYFTLFHEELKQDIQILIGFFCISIAILFIALLILWKCFIQALESEIWKAKGIINLIPTNILMSKKFQRLLRNNFIFDV